MSPRKRTAAGEVQKFYEEVVLQYEGKECLFWPYGRGGKGYGCMKRNGGTVIVPRYVCEFMYGPAPTSEHQAAHSCGKGHLGCVAKSHISWKTPHENQADRLLHGTHSRGARCGKAKLTEDQAREILSLKGAGTQAEIAKRFGVSRQAVAGIHTGVTWFYLSGGRGPNPRRMARDRDDGHHVTSRRSI